MQVEGMRYSQGAYALSQAKFMVLDMTERMRANRAGMRGDVYKGKSTSSGTTAPACISSNLACSPAEIATADLHAWSQNLHAPAGTTGFTPLLPSSSGIPAQGTITFDAAEGSYSIEVQWSEPVKGVETVQKLAVKVFP
jgi:Tfp pilus assembly protein PilV